jgi:predicted nucleic acid-binding Zn ribbon protein
MSSHRLAPRRLSACLEGLTEDLAPATTLARVQRVWVQATGPAISEAARPTSEREGVLTITCSAATWAQELDLMAMGLIARLNEALGEDVVRELRCRTR